MSGMVPLPGCSTPHVFAHRSIGSRFISPMLMENDMEHDFIKTSAAVATLKAGAVRAAERRSVDVGIMLASERAVAMASGVVLRGRHYGVAQRTLFWLCAFLGLAVGYVAAIGAGFGGARM